MSTVLVSTMPPTMPFSRPQFRAPRFPARKAGPTIVSGPLLNSKDSSTRFTESEPLASLPGLPVELIQKIYHECSDIQSVANLSATSRQFRAAYISSQKLLIIENVLENQFGPLHDAIQVVTYNDSQLAHVPRKPDMSMALAQQIVAIGYVVQKWEAIYPLLRWRVHTEHRRTLRAHEAYRFRRAMYRVWLYGKAFHNSAYLELQRALPRPCSGDRRTVFMRRFDDDEITEITELYDILHDMIHNDLCPSNAIIQQRYSQSFPGQAPLYFGTYETYPAQCGMDVLVRRIVLKSDLPTDLVSEAWGTLELNEGVVRDILKLEPDQLLHFKEKLANKAERISYLALMPESFHQCPSTLRYAVESVMSERDYWMGPNHGIDGGILDFLDEKPGGRYMARDNEGYVTDEESSDDVVELEDEDESEEEDDEAEVEVRGV
jgi:hypothetical protein